MIDMYYIEGV